MISCLFKDIEPGDVYQFYIVNGINDFNVCSNYYLINDKDVIKSFLKIGKIGREIKEDSLFVSKQTTSEYRGKIGRNSLTMLMRFLLWKLNGNVYKSLKEWAVHTNPDIIVLQAGDAPFMYDLAYKLSNNIGVPIVIFNTEYYYFETLNWVNGARKGLFFRVFRKCLKHSFRKAIQSAVLSIYNSEWMKKQYDSEFHMPSIYIYQSSDIHNGSYLKSDKKRIAYVGNLSFKRYLSIVEIAKSLKGVTNDFVVEVYGPGDEDAINCLKAESNIRYEGTVGYDKVLEIIQDSHLLLLTESLDPINSKLTEYGFSTKITDYMGTGIPIIAYGSKDNVGIGYLKENKAAFVANTPEKLSEKLRDAISDEDERKLVVKRALELSEQNHRSDKNAYKFMSALQEVVNKYSN